MSGEPRDEAADLARLGELVKTLRARCPWDRRQTHGSLAPHLLEEAYEALDAIEAVVAAEPEVTEAQLSHLQEELGDVLFQVYFHAELASEEGRFTLADVARAVYEKLVSRHPHVFGEASAETAEDVAARWEVLKRSEKKRRGVTATIPEAMPALSMATKLLKSADSLGIALPPPTERARVIEAALDGLERARSAEDEDSGREASAAVGEALLALADLARRARVDPEIALRGAALQLRDLIESAR